ncbi:MAG: hypothetical protein OIF48_04665 [Silicimonas sp.]|nr:hypothetical protein [Silicimonas sp.]
MPLQNRVLATGEIVADPARGLFMGNRGILHAGQKLGHARWKHQAWVTCVLKHRDWHREVMSPGAYTELFFLDEAVALAAGHRPCALCRNADYKAYRTAAGLTGPAGEMDRALHGERAIPRLFGQRRHRAPAGALPDGAVILTDGPKLVFGDQVFPISPGRYGPAETRPEGEVLLLTPPTTVAALRNGYRPRVHPSLSAFSSSSSHSSSASASFD